MLALLATAWLAGPPSPTDRTPLLIPPAASPAGAWDAVAEHAGFVVGPAGSGGHPRVTLIPDGDHLKVVVVDASGGRHETRVGSPTSPADRVAVLAVASSMVRAPAWSLPAPVPPPRAAPPPTPKPARAAPPRPAPGPAEATVAPPPPADRPEAPVTTPLPPKPPTPVVAAVPPSPVAQPPSPEPPSKWRVEVLGTGSRIPTHSASGAGAELRVGRGTRLRPQLSARLTRTTAGLDTYGASAVGAGVTWDLRDGPWTTELGAWAHAASHTHTYPCVNTCIDQGPGTHLAATASLRAPAGPRWSMATELRGAQRVDRLNGRASEVSLSVGLARVVGGR